MTDEQRRTATIAVETWIRESLGNDAALLWLWELTPMPCGLPSDAQLDEGLRIAAREAELFEVLERTHAEMAAQADEDDDEAKGIWR